MIDLVSDESFKVSGRGTVWMVPAPFQMKRDKPEIVGQTIKLNGKLVNVVGVERNLPHGPIAKGEMIGLLVKEAA